MSARVQRERFDVAVVGGGLAGFAAALSAARLGARTLLVERERELGGNATHALVHTICGLYRPAADGDALLAHRGLPGRFAQALREAGAAGEPERAGRVYVLPTYPPRPAALAKQLCDAEPSLSARLGCELVGAELARDTRTRHALRLRDAAAGECEIEAALAIDASGDAELAARGGAHTALAPAHELQIPSYIFRVRGVEDVEVEGFARLRLGHALAGAVRSGQLSEGCESLLVRPGAESGEAYITLNLPRPAGAAYAPLDPACLAELEAGARRTAERVVAFLRSTRPGFEKIEVLAWPGRVGVRETRRLCGVAELTREDILEGRRRTDEVAVSTWPIEIWRDRQRAQLEYPAGSCSIPLGALISRSHPRLGMAGRCLSASHEALGALRVLGTALATGEAAGVAAALAADAGVGLDAIAAADVRHHIVALDARRETP
ncbi:MAG TPA: FAD-dependent oxidoreductase [Myxococcota bacterium]